MICAPLESDSRARWADWLEVSAIRTSGWVGELEIASAIGIGSNEDREQVEPDGEVLDAEITDAPLNNLLDEVSSEVGFRQEALGDDYPFDVKAAPFSIKYKLGCTDRDIVRDIYVFNLIMASIPQSILSSSGLGAANHDIGRRLFHLCASLGVAGLLEQPKTHWFGFPRPDKSGFVAALRDLSEKLGFCIPKIPPPPGLPAFAKDDQVDIVGWRKYGDRTVGTLVILCQAATGNDWNDKAIRNHLEAFTEWFERSPYGLAWSSLAYPFVAHHELTRAPNEEFDLALFNYLKRLNYTHGTVLDRLRIVQGARAVSNRGTAYASSEVAGWDLIPDLQSWNIDAIAGLRASP